MPNIVAYKFNGILYVVLTIDRYYWDTLDPITISEGLFAVASVLSFCRLFYILAVNETLGPLQTSLLRMISVSYL